MQALTLENIHDAEKRAEFEYRLWRDPTEHLKDAEETRRRNRKLLADIGEVMG